MDLIRLVLLSWGQRHAPVCAPAHLWSHLAFRRQFHTPCICHSSSEQLPASWRILGPVLLRSCVCSSTPVLPGVILRTEEVSICTDLRRHRGRQSACQPTTYRQQRITL